MIRKDDRGLVIELPEEILNEVEAQLVQQIASMQVKTPNAFKLIHRNLYSYSDRRMVLITKYFDWVHERALSRISPEILSKVGIQVDSSYVPSDWITPTSSTIASNASNTLQQHITAPTPVKSHTTDNKSELIRQMLRGGAKRADIAKAVGVIYQLVYQVEKKMKEKGEL